MGTAEAKMISDKSRARGGVGGLGDGQAGSVFCLGATGSSIAQDHVRWLLKSELKVGRRRREWAHLGSTGRIRVEGGIRVEASAKEIWIGGVDRGGKEGGQMKKTRVDQKGVFFFFSVYFPLGYHAMMLSSQTSIRRTGRRAKTLQSQGT